MRNYQGRTTVFRLNDSKIPLTTSFGRIIMLITVLVALLNPKTRQHLIARDMRQKTCRNISGSRSRIWMRVVGIKRGSGLRWRITVVLLFSTYQQEDSYEER